MAVVLALGVGGKRVRNLSYFVSQENLGTYVILACGGTEAGGYPTSSWFKVNLDFFFSLSLFLFLSISLSHTNIYTQTNKQTKQNQNKTNKKEFFNMHDYNLISNKK